MTNELQATFADHKKNLIACLRESWGRGSREKPFDPERAWWLIEMIVAVMTKASSATPQELREHAVELAEALGTVRQILARTIKARPELVNQITWAWIWLATGGASAASILSGQTPTDGLGEKLQQAVDGVSALEPCQWNHKPRGNQRGSGRLPPLSLLLLAHVYTQTTELQPTTTETGHFMDFVRALRDTFDIPLGDDAVHRAVKIAFVTEKAL